MRPTRDPEPAGARFPRRLRVRSRAEFDATFRHGTRSSTPAMLVVARKNGLAWSRFGVSVGRRFGRAHRRNRARRLLRESFRLARAAFPVGYDFIVVPRREGFPDTLPEVQQLVIGVAERATRGRTGRPRGSDAQRASR